MPGSCSQCDCAGRVVSGRPEEWVCANHPDHAGQLVLVAGGAAGIGDVPPHCRSFRVRRDAPALPDPATSDAVRYIRLTGGSFALVDAADYEWLSQYTWRAMGGDSGYAYRKVGRKNVCMHRLIMNAPPGKVVDHINGNRQDNRRDNLRVCTHAENMRNCRKSRGTSRFKGVYWDRRRGKWEALICCGGKRVHLGRFEDEVKAAKAYDRAARELFGQYAYLNFPEDGKIVRLSGCIVLHSHAYGRLTVVSANHRQDETSCRCHPGNMPTTSVGMAPSRHSLSSRPEAEGAALSASQMGRSGEIWLRTEHVSLSIPEASISLRSTRHDRRRHARRVRLLPAAPRGPP